MSGGYRSLVFVLFVPIGALGVQPQPRTTLTALTTSNSSIDICSFNIQFLGSSKKRENDSLADVVEPYDIVVVQELVAPPYDGEFPDGTPFKPDPEAAQFFDAMLARGFEYVLSPEDTGTGNKIHINSNATEWFVAYYNPSKVVVADDLPHGFLADDRSNNPDFERVPYAFSFRTPDNKLDFVLISVHLQPNAGIKPATRRRHELSSIAQWIDQHDSTEHDFIVLGDMNIQNSTELATLTSDQWVSLNEECIATNTLDTKPYDHVMFDPDTTTEIKRNNGFHVIYLVQEMKSRWTSTTKSYPGDHPYQHNAFRAAYSDHNPVWFRMNIPAQDDD